MRNEPFIGYHGGCGGIIRFKDWRGMSVRRSDFRFTAFCEKCQACDPNGYAKLDANALRSASNYFHTVPTPPAKEAP